MPINVYAGLMGSGKSYEVTSSVVVPAIAKGRRVVTNIDGISEPLIRDFCLAADSSLDRAKLGTIVHCQNADIANMETGLFNPDFYPWNLELGAAAWAKSFVQPGDLVVLDEAVRFYGTGKKISKEHMLFFTEHRHFADPVSGVTCDVVLMIQDVSLLHRSVKGLVELSFRTKKLKSLGMSKRYVVHMFEGAKQTPRLQVAQEVKRYRKDVFPLYQSYGGGVGREVQVDARQSQLSPVRIALFAGLVVLLLVGGGVFLLRAKRGMQGNVSAQTQAGNLAASVVVAGTPPELVSPAAARSPVGPVRVLLSVRWRLAGYVVSHGVRSVAVVDSGGRLRLEPGADFVWEFGRPVSGTVDGDRVTEYSGALPESGGGGVGGIVPELPGSVVPVPPVLSAASRP